MSGSDFPNYTHRSDDIIPEKYRDKSITVVGAGAIGSFTVLALAKMGFSKIYVVDDDKVEPENIGCQLYGKSDVGKRKAEALYHRCLDSGVEISLSTVRLTRNTACVPGDYVVSAVDNMKTRELIWDLFKLKSIIVDPRMGAEFLHIYVGDNNYPNTLYSDDEAEPEPCTAKATSYTALIAGGLVAKTIKSLVMDKPTPKTIKFNLRDFGVTTDSKALVPFRSIK